MADQPNNPNGKSNDNGKDANSPPPIDVPGEGVEEVDWPPRQATISRIRASRFKQPEAHGGFEPAPPNPPEAFGTGKSPARPKKDRENGDKPEPKDQKSKGDDQDGKEEPAKKPPFYKRPVLMAVLILTALAIIAGGIVYWLHARQFETTDDAFIEGHVTPISPKVAALVAEVHVDDNYHVVPGQLLVKLDPRDLEASLQQARANQNAMRGKLAQAQSQINVQNASVAETRAEMEVAQTNFENADRDLKRYEALDERSRSKQQLDNAVAAQRSAAAQVAQAKAKQTGADAQVANAQDAVKTAQGDVDRADAEVKQAELNLSYCTITASEEGYITRKSVEPGSYVTVGQVLFPIVPSNVWVVANFKETQLDQMRPNQPVDIAVDAYPDRTFHGRVESVQAGTGSRFSLLPAENATGNYIKVVQRVPVKIVFDAGETGDPNHVLGPGLSVQPRVHIR